jgi:GntR family transcriptional regulator
MCPALADWESESGSVFEFLRTKGASEIVRVKQSIEMKKPPEYRAAALNARSSTPCLIIHRVFREASGLAVAYSRTTARGDRFELVTEYERVK